MIFFFLLLVLVLAAQIAELFIPALPWLYNAHVYIVPVIVFYGAMALPFPLMLALALYAGVLLDALTVQVIDTALRCAGRNNARPETALCSRPLGSALHPERHFHFVDSFGAISDDHVPSRLLCFYP
jgi:hypothetical protein